MLLIYRTTVQYAHKIGEDENLVDINCTDYHNHDEVPVVVGVESNEQFLDFKTIRNIVNQLLKPLLSDNDLNELIRNPNATAENFALWLQARVVYHLNEQGFGLRRVRVSIHETTKYGVDTE